MRYPVTLETDFSRPYKAISSSANSDFSLLDDLERLIRGTYIDPRTNKYRAIERIGPTTSTSRSPAWRTRTGSVAS